MMLFSFYPLHCPWRVMYFLISMIFSLKLLFYAADVRAESVPNSKTSSSSKTDTRDVNKRGSIPLSRGQQRDSIIASTTQSESIMQNNHGTHPAPVLIIIPGGGIDSTSLQPQPWTLARLDAAAELYHQHASSNKGVFLLPLSLGTPHKPIPVDETTQKSVTEAGAAAHYLIKKHGVDPDQILEENASLDTVGNAFWVWTTHLQFFFEEFYQGIQQRIVGDGDSVAPHVVVITSRFHMPRTRAIFRHILGLGVADRAGIRNENEVMEIAGAGEKQGKSNLAILGKNQNTKIENTPFDEILSSIKIGSPVGTQDDLIWIPEQGSNEKCSAETDNQQSQQTKNLPVLKLSFLPTADAGMTPEQLQIRTEKEAGAYKTFVEQTRWKLKSMVSLHKWLFSEHGAYASNRHLKVSAGAEVENKALQSTY